MSRSKNYPATPDRRYFVVKGRLWRCSNPGLDPLEKRRLVKELMQARRAVKAALKTGEASSLKAARQQVNAAKIALGERGPVWWSDGAPDYNQKMVDQTLYAEWYKSLLASDSV